MDNLKLLVKTGEVLIDEQALTIKRLRLELEWEKREVTKYKELWRRECEAYKDLAIRTGNGEA